MKTVMMSLRDNTRRHRRPRAAFSLIELLVVVFIIIILVSISVPAFKALSRNNSQKQAVNMLTTLAAQARAMAIQQHAMAGVYIFEDASSINGANMAGQTYAQLVFSYSSTYEYHASNSAYGSYTFSPVPDVPAQPLPRGIAVVTLDDDTNIFKAGEGKDPVTTLLGELGATTTRRRLIAFDENGQLVMRTNLAVQTSTSGPTADKITGSPGFLVFNLADLKTAESIGSNGHFQDNDIGNWLTQYGDVVIFNAYSGNVIR